ncbi:hypothetical protein chiPu_0009358 [Chiloscyllium punctatum]|uniref:Uncharacterized protein n=1 Tax=Chiloscyllium punctatum TaxID=137246 RepID=A0A401SKI3_CHIPU|nr:hypothetical protein [Chiloscyllium punctatum]
MAFKNNWEGAAGRCAVLGRSDQRAEHLSADPPTCALCPTLATSPALIDIRANQSEHAGETGGLHDVGGAGEGGSREQALQDGGRAAGVGGGEEPAVVLLNRAWPPLNELRNQYQTLKACSKRNVQERLTNLALLGRLFENIHPFNRQSSFGLCAGANGLGSFCTLTAGSLRKRLTGCEKTGD